MRSIKIFSNNAVSANMPDGREAVLLGKGIGFGKRPGDEIDETRVEKLFYLLDEVQSKFLKMLQDVRKDVIDAAAEIVALAEAAGFVMSGQAIMSLIDHISFAIERQPLPNLLLNETKILYPKEYALGRQALDHIRDRCGVSLDEDEAGYIALHLIMLSEDRDTAYDTLKFVQGVLDIIKQTYGLALEDDSLDKIRLITHLKFLAQRIFRKAPPEDEMFDEMYDYLYSRNPQHAVCMERLDEYCSKEFGHPLSLQEKFYLLIHLTKIL